MGVPDASHCTTASYCLILLDFIFYYYLKCCSPTIKNKYIKILHFKIYITFYNCIQGNHNKDNIGQRTQILKEKLTALRSSAHGRKAKLTDNSAFLQFIWKTDVVESWISEYWLTSYQSPLLILLLFLKVSLEILCLEMTVFC